VKGSVSGPIRETSLDRVWMKYRYTTKSRISISKPSIQLGSPNTKQESNPFEMTSISLVTLLKCIICILKLNLDH
jgi:hypothetical protein